MSRAKRLRIFAGPNGSGKSTIFEYVADRYRTGPYLNADRIEQLLRENQQVPLDDFGLKASGDAFEAFLKTSGWLEKLKVERLPTTISFKQNRLFTRAATDLSYDAAIVCAYLTHQLLLAGQTFSLETVMSHPSKIQLMEKASLLDYKCYLYYICTQDVLINLDRVANRVRKGEHDVPRQKIRNRYKRSLSQLPEAIRVCYRAFLFDNSGEVFSLKLEFKDGKEMWLRDADMPNWVLENAVYPFFPHLKKH